MNFIKIQGGRVALSVPFYSPGEFGNRLFYVNISEFEISDTKITRSEWRKIMDNSPWDKSPWREEMAYDFPGSENCPACDVSRAEIEIYLSKINEADSNFIYNLPTLAQLTWASGANVETGQYWNADPERIDDDDLVKQHCVYGGSHGDRKCFPVVASLLPNSKGLFDVIGLAGEWVRDKIARPNTVCIPGAYLPPNSTVCDDFFIDEKNPDSGIWCGGGLSRSIYLMSIGNIIAEQIEYSASDISFRIVRKPRN